MRKEVIHGKSAYGLEPKKKGERPLDLFKLFGSIVVDNEKAKDNIDETTETAEKAENKISAAFKKIGEACVKAFKEDEPEAFGTSLENLTYSVKNQQDKLDLLKRKYQDLYLTQGETADETQKCAKEIEELSSELKKNKTAMSDAEGAADKLDKTLEKVDDSSRELSNGGFTVMKGVISNLVSSGLQKLTSALGKFVSDAVGYKRQLEQYQTSFSVMTGSAEKAADVVERLKEIGASTPFELNDLADTTQLLMNYGFTADEAIDRMTMLGDISQGNADKMNRIATAYGQMSSAGKVSLEDIKQMVESGFNPLLEISQHTGESMESLYDRISKGTLSIDEITASMQRSTAEGGKYFGAMDAQSQTFNGRISTLQDTINDTFGNILAPLLQKAADEWIPALTDAVSTLDEKAFALMSWIQENQGLLIAIGSLIGVLTVALGAHSAAVALETAMEATHTTTLWGLVAAQTAAIAPYVLIVAAIAAVIAIGVTLIKHWDTVKAVCVALWESLKESFNGIKEAVSNAWDAIWSTVKGVINNIIGGTENMINSVIRGINKLLSGIDMVASAVGSVLGLNWGVGQISEISLPRLARGGVLEEGQVGLLEGSGAEAVVPLDQNKKWISAVAQDMNLAGIGGSNEIKILLENFIQDLPEILADAFASMRMEFDKREVARMVKAVN